MRAETNFFGEIDIPDDKVIRLENGMIGFPKLKNFGLIFDEEKGLEKSKIMWLQSLDDGDIAFPVMMPHIVKEDYNPTVNNEILSPLGELVDENTFVLVTVTVPKDPKKFTVNLKAPIIINTDNMKGTQVIAEDDYPVKFAAYSQLEKEEKAGE